MSTFNWPYKEHFERARAQFEECTECEGLKLEMRMSGSLLVCTMYRQLPNGMKIALSPTYHQHEYMDGVDMKPLMREAAEKLHAY